MDQFFLNLFKSLIPDAFGFLPGAKEFMLLLICGQALIMLCNMANKKRQNDLFGKRREDK